MKGKASSVILLISMLIVTLNVSSQSIEQDIVSFTNLMESSHSNYYDVLIQANQFFELHPDLMNEEDGVYQDFVRWKLFWGKRISNISPNSGSIDYLNHKYFEYLNSSSSATNNTTSAYSLQPICPLAGAISAKWAPLGPISSPILYLGKVQSILVDESDLTHNTVYIGAPNGGVFKTINFNDPIPNWVCMTENTGIPGLWVNTMSMDPISKDLYLGTGNYRDGYSVGIVGLHQNGQYFLTSLSLGPGNNIPPIKQIIRQANNPDVMFALTDDIVYRTSDSWGSAANLTQSPAPVGNLKNHFYDMAFDPTPSGVALGRVLFTGDLYNGATEIGKQLWSYSGGTWTDLTSNLPVPAYSFMSIEASAGALFLIYSTTSTNDAIYTSTDGGQSWTLVRNFQHSLGQINFGSEARLVMNPNDPNNIYAETYPGRKVNETKDGGLTWILRTSSGYYNGSYNHVDIRYMVLVPNPGNPNHDLVYIGTDGGMLHSNDQTGQTPYLQDKNGIGLNISQFYALSCAEKRRNYFVVGAQDNGTFEFDHGSWNRISGGDGFGSEIENNTEYIYSENSGGAAPPLYYRQDNTYQFTNTNSGNNFISEFLDRNDNDKLYRFEKDVKYSTDHGLNWTTISQFAGNLADVNHCRTITAAAVDPQNNQHLIAVYGGPTWNKDLSQCTNICSPTETCLDCSASGTHCPLSHKYFVTYNGGANWTDETFRFDKFTPLFDPLRTDVFRWSEVTSVVFNPNNSQEIWISFGNFWDNNGVGVNRVNRSMNGGLTWTDYSDNLPPFAVNCMIAQPNSNGGVYVGTDVGVFYRDNSMAQWECFNDGLPIPLVTDLAIDYCRNKLLATTYGRGVWEGNLVPSTVTLPASNVNWNIPKSVYTNIVVPSGCILTITADIDIARGRRITVKQGGLLYIFNPAHLFNGCGEMWDGIYAEPGAVVKVVSSTIEDAYQAFNLRDQVSYDFSGNNFNRNYIGIYLGSDVGRNAINGSITGNHFHCSGSLPPYFDTPIIGVTPNVASFCGVYSMNVDYAEIGKVGASVNRFEDMENGVVSYFSNLTITNTTFDNLNNHQYYNTSFGGCGIYSHSSGSYRLKMIGGNANSPDFKRCFMGVFVDNQHSQISNCLMEDMHTGIEIANCRGVSDYINDNTLHCNNHGILLLSNDLSKFILVIRNNIEIAKNASTTVMDSYGISVMESISNSFMLPHINLLSNLITIHYGLVGIRLNSSELSIVKSNTISLLQDNNDLVNPQELVLGIEVNGCKDPLIASNIVVGSNPNDYSTQFGIDVNILDGTKGIISCNQVSNTKRNFHFGGGLMTCEWQGNTMGDGFEGLHIGPSAAFGTQYHSGNCFGGTFGNPDGAAINLNTDPFFINWSVIFTDPNQLTCYSPTNNQTNWIINDPGVHEFQCTDPGCNPCDVAEVKSIDNAIASNQIGAVTYSDEVKWEGRKYLMEKLSKYPNLMNSNPLLEGFFANYENTTIDKINHIGFGVLDMNQMTTIAALEFSVNDSLISIDMDSLKNLNILLGNSSQIVEEENYKQQINLVTAHMRMLELTNKGIVDAYLLNKEQKASVLKNQNSAISASKIIEQNFKAVNDIYLKTLAIGNYEFTEGMKTTLMNIAVQCPYEGGQGVYMARTLYYPIQPDLVFSDYFNCAQLGYLRTKPKEDSNYNLAQVVPNPVHATAKLNYLLKPDCTGICKVYSNLGKEVLTFELPANSSSTEFTIGDLTSSIYHFIIFVNNIEIATGTFSVAH